jgi:hypothetical protein
LPPGLLRPSATELNITDTGKLADEIHMLLDRTGPLPVALNLPDLSARTVLFEFDTLPTKPAECEALIRWRFQKELNVSAESSQLAYLVFRLDSAKPTTGPARVLATAIRRNIIEQYEQVCEKAQIIPIRVGLPGLTVFDLCRPLIEETLGRSSLEGPGVDEFFFMSVTDESFCFLAVRDGTPAFLRLKSRNGMVSASSSAASDCRSGPLCGSPPDSPIDASVVSLLPKATLADELKATLQFYDEANGKSDPPRAGRPLFIVGHTGAPVLNPMEAQGLTVNVVMIGPDWFPVFQTRQHEASAPSSLAAMAGLYAA